MTKPVAFIREAEVFPIALGGISLPEDILTYIFLKLYPATHTNDVYSACKAFYFLRKNIIQIKQNTIFNRLFAETNLFPAGVKKDGAIALLERHQSCEPPLSSQFTLKAWMIAVREHGGDNLRYGLIAGGMCPSPIEPIAVVQALIEKDEYEAAFAFADVHQANLKRPARFGDGPYLGDFYLVRSLNVVIQQHLIVKFGYLSSIQITKTLIAPKDRKFAFAAFVDILLKNLAIPEAPTEEFLNELRHEEWIAPLKKFCGGDAITSGIIYKYFKDTVFRILPLKAAFHLNFDPLKQKLVKDLLSIFPDEIPLLNIKAVLRPLIDFYLKPLLQGDELDPIVNSIPHPALKALVLDEYKINEDL